MEKNKIIEDINKIAQNKKLMFWLTVSALIIIIIFGSWVRTLNMSLLKDVTTGEYIPLALDPFYFLRIAKTQLAGGLPAYDNMRYPSAKAEFSKEILPNTIVFMYNIAKIFDKSITIGFIDVIYPVIFFAFELIIFFFLIFYLTKSKSAAFLSCTFLAVIPTYLHRTMAGFADHEAIGMLSFFSVLLFYTIALKFLDKDSDKKSYYKTIIWGIFIGFLTSLTIASWGGIGKFVFMIIPLSFFIFWLLKTQPNNLDEDKGAFIKYIIFYLLWLISAVLLTGIFGYSINKIFAGYITTTQGLISPFVAVFMILDYLLILGFDKDLFKRFKLNKKYRILYNFLIFLIGGFVGLLLIKQNPFSFVNKIIQAIIHPFGLDRVGLTVAENAQPYLLDWMNQTGKIFFWLFFLGIIFVGIEIAKTFNKNKHKILFSLFWVIMICGLLFSRISGNSLLNGSNLLSQFVYFAGLIILVLYAFWIYLDDRIKLSPELILIFSWLFFMLIAGRGAVRLFFVITPFVCFMSCFLVVRIFDYAKKSKDELVKMLLWAFFIIVCILLVISFFSFKESIIAQAKYTGPSANLQWQKAMSWVRNETPNNSIFVHWWDYGYWVQYLGERPTVTDGGHAVGYWDHLIGRYVLTTPYPETALSFMKTHNVSYLLIDPTDIGKYTAYSSIGDDKEESDRYSWIPTMLSDPKQIQETSEGMIIIYQGGPVIDEDIIYNQNNTQIFLPKQKAGIAGIILEIIKDNNSITFKQPEAVIFYNGKRIQIPLRYTYYSGRLIDYKEGLNATIYIIPQVYQSGEGLQVDNLGALIYLSPRITRSLVGQLYLLDDPFNRFEGFNLVHSESSPIIESLEMQGIMLNEFIYYQGVQGPIKIWEIDYPDNIIAREEFLRIRGDYGEFDYLEFIR